MTTKGKCNKIPFPVRFKMKVWMDNNREFVVRHHDRETLAELRKNIQGIPESLGMTAMKDLRDLMEIPVEKEKGGSRREKPVKATAGITCSEDVLKEISAIKNIVLKLGIKLEEERRVNKDLCKYLYALSQPGPAGDIPEAVAKLATAN